MFTMVLRTLEEWANGNYLICTGILYILWKWSRKTLKNGEERPIRRRKLIVISGCDSGLGLSMSKWAFDSGYSVLAGCLDCQGQGGHFLKSLEPNDNDTRNGQMFVHALDVTKKESIQRFFEKTVSILDQNDYELHALIPNAAVCYAGEFFWYTERQMKEQMDVCFWGAVNLTLTFQPLLLEYQSKVIVISSECAETPLPGLSIYSASKAALQNWSMGFRLEVAKYGVSVITLLPGSFVMQSRIMCGQSRNGAEMKDAMDKSLLDFYGETIDKFNSHYINNFDQSPPPIQPIKYDALQNKFLKILNVDLSRHTIVRCTGIGEVIFHFLINYLPTSLSDSLINKVMNAPEWTKRQYMRKRQNL